MEKTECEVRKNNRWKWYRISLWVIMLLSVAAICMILLIDIYRAVPDTIYLKAGEESQLSLHVPLSGELKRQKPPESRETIGQESGDGILAATGTEVLGTDATESEAAAVQETVGEGVMESIHVDLTGTVTLLASTQSSYSMDLKLFGVIPFKTVRIEVIDNTMLYPVGMPIGIYVKTTGVLVVGTGDFTDVNGNKVMPSEHLLQTGDYILSVDGTEVEGKSDFVKRVAESQGKTMVMTIDRDGQQFDIGIRAEKNEAREYKLGIWVKDSAQGIGTLTYADTDGQFGALGHGVSDSDIGTLLNLSDGALYRTDIVGITKGTKGTPGELTGIIRYTESNRLGEVTDNSNVGIHGTLEEEIMDSLTQQPLPIGLKQEIQKGAAQIYCNVDGTARYYDIEIIGIDYDSENINKSITIQVTDEKLLALTGGIVQGMSGSPIIQDGKIIGAVTHVLVNDPTRGYGIFIENMLEYN